MPAALGPWPLRVLWLLGPVLAGPRVTEALADQSRPVADVLAVLLWTGWVVVLVSVLVPRTVSLTILRIGAPAALAANLWAPSVAGVSWAIVTCVVALSAPTADQFVDGSSYGPETRMLLRTPGPLLLGPVFIAWAAVAAGVATPPLLAAARQWVAAVVSLPVAAVLAVTGVRAIHSLSRRWLVFVPGGLVLHDHTALAEPMLFPRSVIASLSPARRDPDGERVDLSVRALGLALELCLREPVDLLVRASRTGTEEVHAVRIVFTPARPARVLAEARGRRIAVE